MKGIFQDSQLSPPNLNLVRAEQRFEPGAISALKITAAVDLWKAAAISRDRVCISRRCSALGQKGSEEKGGTGFAQAGLDEEESRESGQFGRPSRLESRRYSRLESLRYGGGVFRRCGEGGMEAGLTAAI